jgi:hypothetical protein
MEIQKVRENIDQAYAEMDAARRSAGRSLDKLSAAYVGVQQVHHRINRQGVSGVDGRHLQDIRIQLKRAENNLQKAYGAINESRFDIEDATRDMKAVAEREKMSSRRAASAMYREAAVEFNVTQYEFSHGKPPRGNGYWAFSRDRRGNNPVFSPSMSYADAKKWAKAQPEFAGAHILYVQP